MTQAPPARCPAATNRPTSAPPETVERHSDVAESRPTSWIGPDSATAVALERTGRSNRLSL